MRKIYKVDKNSPQKTFVLLNGWIYADIIFFNLLNIFPAIIIWEEAPNDYDH